MIDLAALILERARLGQLNSLSLIASSGANGKPATLFKASVRNPKNGALSTGHDVGPVQALIIALRGDNAGINRTKKRAKEITGRGVEPDDTEAEMDFG